MDLKLYAVKSQSHVLIFDHTFIEIDQLTSGALMVFVGSNGQAKAKEIAKNCGRTGVYVVELDISIN